MQFFEQKRPTGLDRPEVTPCEPPDPPQCTSNFFKILDLHCGGSGGNRAGVTSGLSSPVRKMASKKRRDGVTHQQMSNSLAHKRLCLPSKGGIIFLYKLSFLVAKAASRTFWNHHLDRYEGDGPHCDHAEADLGTSKKG